MTTLIQLSENDKRVIFAIILVVVILLVVLGLIGYIIYRVMKWQSKKMDHLVHDVTITKVITDSKHFISYGRKKNWREFFRQAWIPFVVLLLDFIFIMVFESCLGWRYNPFSVEEGFGSLFFTWKLSDTEYVNLWLIAFRKWEVINTPHISTSPNAWAGYVFSPILIIFGAWYFVTVQCLVSRTIRLYVLSKSIFNKSLEGYNQNTAFTDNSNNGVNNNINNNNPNPF